MTLVIEHPDQPLARKAVSPTRNQKRSAKTRQRLLNAALTMFSEKGIDATAIEDITELADLGKGTFYRHFSGKEELVVALIGEVIDRLVSRLQLHGQAGNLEEAISQMLSAHLDFFRDRREEFVLLFQGRLLLKLQREVAGELEQPYLEYLKVIEKSLKSCVIEPIGAMKVRRVAYALAGFVSGFLSFAMIGLEPENIESSLQPLRQAFVAAVLAFVAGPPQTTGALPGLPQSLTVVH